MSFRDLVDGLPRPVLLAAAFLFLAGSAMPLVKGIFGEEVSAIALQALALAASVLSLVILVNVGILLLGFFSKKSGGKDEIAKGEDRE